MDSEARKKLFAIIADHMNIDLEKVVPTASFIDNLGADSLDLVELIMELEEEFDITIPDEDAEKITTVQAALDYISQKT